MLYYWTLVVESKRVIFIPKGSTGSIITYLNKNNYSLNFIDKLTIKSLGYPQSGWIDLKTTSMSKFDFLYKLTTSKAALRDITLIPGETYYFFLKELSTKLKIPETSLFQTYFKMRYKKDGNILPQTYTLPIGMNTKDLLQYLFNYTNNKYKSYSTKIFGHYDKAKWYKYITVASIIQKEAASKNEMVKISSVIYNRLKKNMRLQMDGTLNYGKLSHTKITPKLIRNNFTTYNTYKHKGIPTDPICAVEFDAIKAAIFPLKTDYLYFVKSSDGKKHIFSTNYKSHKKTIKKIIKIKKFKKKKIKVIKHKSVKKLHKKHKRDSKTKLKNLWNSVK